MLITINCEIFSGIDVDVRAGMQNICVATVASQCLIVPTSQIAAKYVFVNYIKLTGLKIIIEVTHTDKPLVFPDPSDPAHFSC